MWFITYRHPLRPDEGGIRFVRNEAETVGERLRLEAGGYIVTSIVETSHARIQGFLAKTLGDLG